MTPQRPPEPGPGDPGGRVVFRPGLGRLLAVGWWALTAVLAVDLVRRGEASSALLGVPLLAFSAALVHALFWYPAVAVDDDGVELVNVLRRVRLPWASLQDLDTRWTLTVEAGERRWTSWAAPASGRRVRPVSRRDAPWVEPGADAIAGSRAPGSSAGEAAILVGTRWQVWQDRAARGLEATGGTTGGDAPVVRWNLLVVLTLGATTLAAVAAVARAWSG